MSEFSSTEAALEGLRVSRERPLAVVWWWAAYVLVAVLEFGISLLPTFRRLESMTPLIQAQYDAVQQNPSDMLLAQRLLALLGQAAPAFLLFAAVVLILQMVLSTAVLRAVLRPAESRFGYLRLSMDEIRQLGLSLIMVAAGMLYLFVIATAASVVLSLLQPILPPLLVSLLATATLLVALIYPLVRLSLAPAMTLADGRVSFLRAWILTKGQFWSLFGTYLIAFAVVFALLAARYAILRVVEILTHAPINGIAEPQTLPGLFSP